MKKHTDQPGRSVLLATITAIFLLGAFGSTFAQKKGAITEQEVKAYFTDWWTHDCDKSRECKVTFDSPVRIAPAVRHTFQIPPTTYLTYPVKVDMTTHANGGTFHLTHYTHAIYYFYRNSFGEWEMGKEDERTTQEKDEHQAGGPKTQTKNDPPKGAEQLGKDKNPPDTDQNGFPKPDFAELEKYYEIAKYEYKAQVGDNQLYIYVKQKTEQIPYSNWFVQFRDKDGLLITTGNPYGNGITRLWAAPVGELIKASVYTPTEKEMEKVVSAKLVRIKQ
ncbi:MAG: hypothetical protein ABIO36_06655 [Pyrinomonadaceae bacterium]